MCTLQNLCKTYFTHLSIKEDDYVFAKNKDLRCLQESLDMFLETGSKEDAFVVYFCFCEIYNLFGKGYDNTKKLLELLSDHEYHSGELLLKYRDHYSHSVYVFALGLAIFANNEKIRSVYREFYKHNEEGGYIDFLRYWGLVSLFHDIGYPFQLAHTQIRTYCRELWGTSDTNPYVSYGNMESFIAIDKSDVARIWTEDANVSNINDILAYAVNKRMGYDINEVTRKLYARVVEQPNHMDHGYFSSVLILKQLLSSDSFCMSIQMLDVLSAILLHNRFNKYDEISNSRPVVLEEHPLAFMLILCDELQNWDRYAYGKISKRDPLAYDVRFNITNDKIQANYIFDRSTIDDDGQRLNQGFEKIQNGIFAAKITGGCVGNKTYRGFISSSIDVEVSAEEITKDRNRCIYTLSDGNLVDLYNLAVAIHSNYLNVCNVSSFWLNKKFGELPLEFKVSNIQQAKSFAKKLELINCFYSDKQLDYPVVESFDVDENGNVDTTDLEFLSHNEHVRWVREKIKMGWKYGCLGVDFSTIEERNDRKLHNCIVPYEMLSELDKNKDRVAVKGIIPMLKKLGSNIAVYRLPYDTKPPLVVAGVGCKYCVDDRLAIKKRVKSILIDLNTKYNLIVRTCYAYGADQLIAECANELNIPTHAILPYVYDDFINYVRKDAIANGVKYTQDDEMRLRLLLAQTSRCDSVRDCENDVFETAALFNVTNSNKLIAVLDKKEPLSNDYIDRPVYSGGVYDCVIKAKEAGLREEDIFVI